MRYYTPWLYQTPILNWKDALQSTKFVVWASEDGYTWIHYGGANYLQSAMCLMAAASEEYGHAAISLPVILMRETLDIIDNG